MQFTEGPYAGQPKGLRYVLSERGLLQDGIKQDEMVARLSSCADFKAQLTEAQQMCASRGHIAMYLPRFHCEYAWIERNWCKAKEELRTHCNYSIKALRTQLPIALDSVTVQDMRRYQRKCLEYMQAHRDNTPAEEMGSKLTELKSHRRVHSQHS
jgi:hypothetical protein